MYSWTSLKVISQGHSITHLGHSSLCVN